MSCFKWPCITPVPSPEHQEIAKTCLVLIIAACSPERNLWKSWHLSPRRSNMEVTFREGKLRHPPPPTPPRQDVNSAGGGGGLLTFVYFKAPTLCGKVISPFSPPGLFPCWQTGTTSTVCQTSSLFFHFHLPWYSWACQLPTCWPSCRLHPWPSLGRTCVQEPNISRLRSAPRTPL